MSDPPAERNDMCQRCSMPIGLRVSQAFPGGPWAAVWWHIEPPLFGSDERLELRCPFFAEPAEIGQELK